MKKHIPALVFIYMGVTAGWFILMRTVEIRTTTQDERLRSAVGQLWGTPQRQQAPTITYETTHKVIQERVEGKKKIREVFNQIVTHDVPLEGSTIDVKLEIDYRRKGLLWYSTYRVQFSGKYKIINPSEQTQEMLFDFPLPASGAIYDNFRILIGGKEVPDITLTLEKVHYSFKLLPGQEETVEVRYESQGMEEWWYVFGTDVTQIRNFTLTMNTNFEKIDFPQTAIAPTEKERTAEGWKLVWKYTNLLTGVQIGMDMPRKLNPGPWVARVTRSAPVSLFLFFFLLFVITAIRQIKLHPMHYFFIGCAFFSFHLLLAYLVDHVSVPTSFLIWSVVSIFLVVSYVRLVVGPRFALLETGLSQFVYLVLFSYTFFFEGYTGLAITILAIITLFIVMQATARVDWEKVFA